jgi:hypothetical protein
MRLFAVYLGGQRVGLGWTGGAQALLANTGQADPLQSETFGMFKRDT